MVKSDAKQLNGARCRHDPSCCEFYNHTIKLSSKINGSSESDERVQSARLGMVERMGLFRLATLCHPDHSRFLLGLCIYSITRNPEGTNKQNIKIHQCRSYFL